MIKTCAGLFFSIEKKGSGGYRYGFNGKEDDNDIEAGAQDYGMRIYDGRIGKFLSVDPLSGKYAFYSPYQFAGNSPIAAIDEDGLEPVGAWGTGFKGSYVSMEPVQPYHSVSHGNTIEGTLYKVTDELGVKYWVVEQTKTVMTEDLTGKNYAENKERFYFTKPPNLNTETYNGGTWEGYDDQTTADAKAVNKMADQFEEGVFWTATGLSAGFAGAGAGGSGALGGAWEWYLGEGHTVISALFGDPVAAYGTAGLGVLTGGGIAAYEIQEGEFGQFGSAMTEESPSPAAAPVNQKPNTLELAKEAHSFLDPIAQNHRVTAIGIDDEGHLYIASSEKTVPKVQREWAESKGITVVNGQGHAEETLMQNPKITHIDASSGVCLDCENQMKSQNVTTNTNTTGKKSRNRR